MVNTLSAEISTSNLLTKNLTDLCNVPSFYVYAVLTCYHYMIRWFIELYL